MKKILFVSHYADRTGAAIFLLRLLHWLRANSDLDFDVLLLEDGPLRDDFAKLAPVYLWRPWWKPGNVLLRGARHLVQQWRRWLTPSETSAILLSSKYSLIYANSICSSLLFNSPDRPRCPVITNVHEAYSDAARYAREGWEKLVECTSCYIFPSDAALTALTRACPRIKTPMFMIPGFVDALPRSEPNRFEMRDSLGISNDAFVVGLSGGAIPVKGLDMLARLAAITRNMQGPCDIRFIWVGADRSSELTLWALRDLKKLGLSNVVTIIPPVVSPGDYFQCFDAFVMLSREESFGLVLIEAAAFGVPLLAFEGAGGPSEIIGEDTGILVPYADLHAMAQQIVGLANDPALREKLGKAAAIKVREKYTADVICPKILGTINQLMDKKS
jgi:glycosyltransferase involved in cell wall biosynthesis